MCNTSRHMCMVALAMAGAYILLDAAPLLAQVVPPVVAPPAANPWQSAVTQLQTAMTGPIARGLSLVAIVVGGLMFAFGEGGSKKAMAGLVFGLGMALSAANFLDWLFQ